MFCMNRVTCTAGSSKVGSSRGGIGRCDLLALLLSTRDGVFALSFKRVGFGLVQLEAMCWVGAVTLLAQSARTCRTLHPQALLLPEAQRDRRKDPGLQLFP